MDDNKIEQVRPSGVHIRTWGVRRAVGALKELCKIHEEGHLYEIVSDKIDSEFDECEAELAKWYNDIVDKCNEARSRLAGEGVNPNAVQSETCNTLASSFTVDIKEVGFSRIGKSDAWCLRLNGEDLIEAVLPEREAKRIFDAISRWRDSKGTQKDNA